MARSGARSLRPGGVDGGGGELGGAAAAGRETAPATWLRPLGATGCPIRRGRDRGRARSRCAPCGAQPAPPARGAAGGPARLPASVSRWRWDPLGEQGDEGRRGATGTRDSDGCAPGRGWGPPALRVAHCCPKGPMPTSVALFAEPVTTGHNREGTEPKINPAGRGMEKELPEPETAWLLGGERESFTHSFIK